MSAANAKTVEDARARFPLLFNEGRFDELGTWFYAEDAIALPADHDLIEGRGPICDYLAGLREATGLRFELGVLKIVAGASSASVIGTYVATTADGARAEGLTHEAWVRQSDGTWKCSVDMWHDRP
ncbi:YybH family protein [Nakamurella leprariae]|uniref:DUF4440 domain-containing protein n=1 Tax=Nakamurella leprariae TaxID=2803911 RepID=A0A939C287_9ACTN|nr:hypothetical protein [Nakamurella leprariae]MBM9467964.1 hypothetical protein [Nakamurella leprariae]